MAEGEDRDAAVEEARQLISAGMIAELITDIRQMAAAIITFADRLNQTDRSVAELHSLRRRNGVIAAAALGLVCLLAGVVIFGYARLTDIARDNNRNGRILVECTTPAPTLPERPSNADDAKHECYERGQQSQGRAVGSITDTLVNTGVCSRLESSEPAIRACIKALATTTTQP